jgi:hypothetical protein
LEKIGASQTTESKDSNKKRWSPEVRPLEDLQTSNGKAHKGVLLTVSNSNNTNL